MWTRDSRLSFVAELDRLDSQRALWATPSSPDDHPTDRDEQQARVRQALVDVLTPRQRLVVERFFFDGLSQGQIAAELGVSQQVVSRTLHGTRRNGGIVGGALPKLRRALSPSS